MKSKRKYLTMPDNLYELIIKSTKKTGSSFAEWMRDAAREKLGITAVFLAFIFIGCDSIAGLKPNPDSTTYEGIMLLRLDAPMDSSLGAFPEQIFSADWRPNITIKQIPEDSGFTAALFFDTVKYVNAVSCKWKRIITYYNTPTQQIPDTLACLVFAVYGPDTASMAAVQCSNGRLVDADFLSQTFLRAPPIFGLVVGEF